MSTSIFPASAADGPGPPGAVEFRVAVIGCRSFDDYALLAGELDALAIALPGGISEIIAVGATGMGALATRYARERQIPRRLLLPDYLPPIPRTVRPRHVRLVEAADLVVVFYDGHSRGCRRVLREACLRRVRAVVIPSCLDASTDNQNTPGQL